MIFVQKPGAVRWKRCSQNFTVSQGWDREVFLLVKHPITGAPVQEQAWVRETLKGEAGDRRGPEKVQDVR